MQNIQVEVQSGKKTGNYGDETKGSIGYNVKI